MPDPCEYIYEGVGLSSSFNHGQSITLDEYIATSTAQTTSTHTRMFETVGCTGLFARSLTLKNLVEEAVDLAVSNGFSLKPPIMAESIGCTNAFTFSAAVSVNEAVGLAETYGLKTSAYKVVAEAVRLTSLFRTGMTSNVAESVAAVNAFTYTPTIVKLVSESVGLSSSYPSAYVSRAAQAVRESVGVANSYTQKATTSYAVSERVSVAEMFWFRDQGQLGWQMNTETTALSWNTNFMFDSIAQYGNTVLAVAPDGVYLLSGETDDGVAIASTLKTGFMDFDDRKVKRLGDVYFGLRGSALRLAIEPFGALAASEYDMPAFTTISPGSNRITPGKGLASRYWRMTFKNVAGGDFDIDNIELDVASSTQRRL